MNAPPSLRYDRLYRTTSSEAFLLSMGEVALGRLELHYAQGVVFGLLLLEEELSGEVLRPLTSQIDDDLVWTAGVAREDFVLSIYVGRELATIDDAGREKTEDSQNGDNGH